MLLEIKKLFNRQLSWSLNFSIDKKKSNKSTKIVRAQIHLYY